MPSRSVPRRVEDFILYYYAKLVIAPSAGQTENYRFIIDRYKRLKSGEIRMSDYDREIQHLARQRGLCAFCGNFGGDLVTEVVPRCLGGPVGIENLVYACGACATSKGDLAFLEWWCGKLGRDKDELPRIPAGLFLKMTWERHQVDFTLGWPCHDILDIWHGSKP
jgi:hypothetical protein